jgi:putative tricarboxylic transport membrane protein
MIGKFFSPDRIGGILSILLGFLSIKESIKLYPYGNKLLTGDHTFPGVIGVLLIIAGLTLVFKRNHEPLKEGLPKGKTARIMVTSILSLLVYCFLIGMIGYFFSTIITFIFLFKTMGNYRWLFSLVLAVILTTAFYLLFIVLLKTPFPSITLPF